MIKTFIKVLVLGGLFTLSAPVLAAPNADSWDMWLLADQRNEAQVDHSSWQQLLNVYLVTETLDGIYRFDYGAGTVSDRARLQTYLDKLSVTDPRGFRRMEQRAYWINLYNALTISLVLDHYPVASIKNIKSGFLSFGPWDKEVTQVAGQPLTLNDIEHRILRPTWDDPRIHYAVNCASLGCPNIAPQVFTATNTEELLEAGARDYINHPRGIRFTGSSLQLSSIYEWYAEDFGADQAALLDHLAGYADEDLAARLREHQGAIEYDYDWRLNDAD